MGRRHQVDYPQVPQSQQSYQQPTQQQPRFSWIASPVEQDQRQRTNNGPWPHAVDSTRREEAAGPPPAELSTPEPEQGERPKERETGMTQESYRTTLDQAHLPEQQTQDSTPDIKNPLPTKQREEKPTWAALAPDENPLAPQSPTYATRQERRNTNMGILAPPTTNYTPVAYQPIPQPIRGGSWQHGLCSCAEPTICMTGLFCPCLLYGKIQYRLSLRSDKKDATNLLGYKSVNGSCVAWSVLCGINGILSGIQKSRIRTSYEMESGSGNCFSDCAQGCCCCCCVLAQSEKELKHREEEGRKVGPSQTQGYVPPGGMTFSTQR